jgi:hypothetical protein
MLLGGFGVTGTFYSIVLDPQRDAVLFVWPRWVALRLCDSLLAGLESEISVTICPLLLIGTLLLLCLHVQRLSEPS